MAVEASELQTHDTLRWDEDLSQLERARIASELESKRNRPDFCWVNVAKLRVDEKYQRPVSQERVMSIVRYFNWRLFQSLWIGERKDGQLYVVDGRHRLSAAHLFGPELMPEVPCEIRRTTGTEEEARIFVELTEKRRRLTSAQRFYAKLLYNDPEALAIQSAMRKHGFITVDIDTIDSRGYRKDQISAIGTLEIIYRAGGKKMLDNVLAVIRDAWDGAPATTSQWMLRAVARCFERVPDLDRTRWAHELRKKDPWGVIERGQRHGHSNGIPQSEALADVLQALIP